MWLRNLLTIIILTTFANSCFFFGNYGGVTYQLYTRLNKIYGQPLIYSDGNSILRSNFDNSKPTRIIIHGFGQNGRSIINRDMKNSYLRRDDFNVIIVDWSSFASYYYQYARYQVNPVGMAVARFIDGLNPNFTTLHLIGYDLGAHIAGIAGQNTQQGKIARIIGLDPSLPLFSQNTPANRLSTGDAQLVEIFHSNGGQLGFFTRLGDVDFYINNGKTQPECVGRIDAYCSHYRAVIVFQRLINKQNNFVTVPCENLGQLTTGCSKNPIEIFLEEINPSGIYQISTVNAEVNNKNVEEGINKDVENI